MRSEIGLGGSRPCERLHDERGFLQPPPNPPTLTPPGAGWCRPARSDFPGGIVLSLRVRGEAGGAGGGTVSVARLSVRVPGDGEKPAAVMSLQNQLKQSRNGVRVSEAAAVTPGTRKEIWIKWSCLMTHP